MLQDDHHATPSALQFLLTNERVVPHFLVNASHGQDTLGKEGCRKNPSHTIEGIGLMPRRTRPLERRFYLEYGGAGEAS